MGIRDTVIDGISGFVGDVLRKAVGGDDSGSMALTVAGQGPEDIPPTPATDQLKGLLFDPFALIDQLGFRDRPSGLTYNLMRETARRVPTFMAIERTRVNQVSCFATPQVDKRDPGFEIRLRDDKAVPSRDDQRRMAQLTDWMMQTGSTWGPGRDDFKMFLRKIVPDSLELDQACHPAGTLIEMGNGRFKPIEDIEVGDAVRTHCGRVRRVNETKRRLYSGNLVHIRSGGQSVIQTEGHPLLAVADRWFRLSPSRAKGIKPTWVESGELTDENYLVYPKPQIEEKAAVFNIFTGDQRQYPNIPYADIAERAGVHPRTAREILCGRYRKNGPAVEVVKTIAAELGWKRETLGRPAAVALTPELALFFGLYAAEGNATKKGGIFFTFHEDELELVELVSGQLDALGINFGITEIPEKSAVTINAASVDLYRFLKEHFGENGHVMRIPEWLFSAPHAIREAFVAGYLAGDGGWSRGTCTLRTISLDLFSGLRVLCASIGIYARLVVTPEKRYEGSYGVRNNAEIYSAALSGPSLRKLTGFGLNAADTPARPRNSFIQDDEFFYLKISQVTRAAVENFPVFNLEVADDHSYIANGFASHNCFEIVRNRKGVPAEFYALDGATIRLADLPPGAEAHSRRDQVKYVQVYDEIVISEFSAWDLCFGIRNPRTDIRANGYGHSEVEMLIATLTSTLYAFEYNKRFFSNGSSARGILNFKGAVPDTKLDGFRRQWQMMMNGVQNVGRIPMTNVDDLQYINFNQNNRDMEFSAWLDFLIKITAAVMQFDPAEINFTYGNTGQGQAMFGTPVDQKLKNSKDRGLRPLLDDVSQWLNVHLIWQLDPRYKLAFVGLDAKGADQAVDLGKKKATYLMTVDELRAEDDLQPLPDGKGQVVLDPTWLQFSQALDASKQQQPDQGADQGGPNQELNQEFIPKDQAPDDSGDDLSTIFQTEKSLPSDELRKSASVRRTVIRYEVDL